MTMIGKRRRTPNFDPPSDARLATIHEGGPKAWDRDLCDRVESNACRRGNVETRAGGTVGARAESTARTRSTRMWTALSQRTLGREQSCIAWRHAGSTAGGVRAAPPGQVR